MTKWLGAGGGGMCISRRGIRRTESTSGVVAVEYS